MTEFWFGAFVLFRRILTTMSSDARIPSGLSSTITLNDGVVMPMFGLGTYMLSGGVGGDAETITSFALQNGYRLLDTATFYGYDGKVAFLWLKVVAASFSLINALV